MKKDAALKVWLDTQLLTDIQNHADLMTKKNAVEDKIKKVPPSRQRRPVGLSVAARDLINKGLEVTQKNEK
jgi:hypothetical protein